MHCTQCGKEIPEGAQFCPSCGAGRDGTPAGMTADDTKYTKGWSWGGFFAPWIFMFVHKQKKYGWMILLVVLAVWAISISTIFGPSVSVPVGILALSAILGITRLVVSIVVGITGRSMVWRKGVYSSVADMRKRSSFGAKLTIAYIIVEIILVTFVGILGVAKKIAQESHAVGSAVTSAAQGAVVSDDMMQEALASAKSKYPMIVDADFESGYMEGTIYGADATLATKSIQDDSASFAVGYSYGFGVSCMEKYNDQNACTTRDQQALGQ